MKKWLIFSGILLLSLPLLAEVKASVPILLYHRFGPVVADRMTVTSTVFESHLQYLHDHSYTVIPLRDLVNGYLRRSLTPAPQLVAICADDGHRSVYTDLFPLVKKHRIHVTLFLYPSAISNASYAMTWDQLRELKETGLFDFQSHSYWHPNFKKDRERLKAEEYERFVEDQLKKSKEILEKELQARVDMLAWPFGIYDDHLIKKAVEAGYAAGFTIQRHPTGPSDSIMALPRFLMTSSDTGKAFERIIGSNSRGK